MKFSKLLLVVTLICMPVYAFAVTPGQQLQAYLASISTMTSSFNQVVKTRKGRVLQRSTGQMAINRPGRFRWETGKPSHQLIVADGKRLWVYDYDLKQVTVQSQTRGLGRTPAQFLSGYDKNLTRDYNVQFKNGNFQLSPRSRDTSFSAIWLRFRGAVLSQLYLVDNLGQVSTITFSGMRINQRLDPRLFRFSPPRGVDVVRQR